MFVINTCDVYAVTVMCDHVNDCIARGLALPPPKLVINLILKVKKESDEDLFTAVVQFLFRIFLCHFWCPPSC